MKAKAFTTLVVVVALAAVAALWSWGPPVRAEDYGTIAMLAALATTAEFMSFLLPEGASGSLSFIPYMTAVLLVPNAGALGAIVITRILVELGRTRGGLKLAFNTFQLLLAHTVAIAVFLSLGGVSIYSLANRSAAGVTLAIGLPMLVAYVATIACNSLMVSHVIALTKGASTLQIWRENHGSTIWIDILSTPIVFVFAWAYASYGPMVASLLWIPILGLRQLNTTNLELAQTNRELLELMVKSIEARDPYTSGHSRRVKEYAIKIAKLLGLGSAEVEEIGTAALLHDVGKIYDKYAPILAKEDRLSLAEWAVIKEHPADGAALIATMTRLRSLVPAVRHHHENWDGSGYPDGLKEGDIPLASRVIMIADTLDAMTTKRPYREPLEEAKVRAELIRCRGKQFDPAIADRLLASDFWQNIFPPKDRAVKSQRIMRLLASSTYSESVERG